MGTLNSGVFVNTDEQMCWKPAVNWGDRSVAGWHMSRNRFPLNGTFSFFFSFSSFNSTCPTCSTWRPTTKSLSGLTSYLKQVDVEVATLPIVTAWSWAKGRNGHFGAALKPQCGGRNAKNHERVSGHWWSNSAWWNFGTKYPSQYFDIFKIKSTSCWCLPCVRVKQGLIRRVLSEYGTHPITTLFHPKIQSKDEQTHHTYLSPVVVASSKSHLDWKSEWIPEMLFPGRLWEMCGKTCGARWSGNYCYK